MPVSLFKRDNNTIDVSLLCPESRVYLTGLNGFTLPDNLDLEDLCFQINENGKEEPYQDKPQRKREILDNLIQFENNHKDELESHHQQAQNKAKKLSKWAIGIGLTTLLLLTAATLAVIFFPPAAALILPLFAAIGSWSPLLLLSTVLPTLAIEIPSLISTRAKQKSKTQLDERNVILSQIAQEKTSIPVPASRTSAIYTDLLTLSFDSHKSSERKRVPQRSTSASSFFPHQPAASNAQHTNDLLISFSDCDLQPKVTSPSLLT